MGESKSGMPADRYDETMSATTGLVLVVDDSQDTREITQVTLERRTKLKVVQAANGVEALAILEKMPIEVIILDHQMPEMTGVEFFQILRNKSIYIPVIFLTGYCDENMRRDQLKLGAFDYLEKPVRANDLIVLVAEAVKVMERIREILVRKA